MERLTEKHYLGTDHYMTCSGNCNVDMDCIDCPSFDRLVERLAAYEDTGLTPEDCARATEIDDILLDEYYPIGRMRELIKADKAGRLVVPPCKAGDTVYEVTSRKTISEYRVKAIRVKLFCTFIEWDIVAGFVDKSIFGVPVNEIGKTVFLTREEADRALEGKRNA